MRNSALSYWKNGYVLNQIFNADETGMNYKMLPQETLVLRTERSAPGAKKSKQGVSILNCTNVPIWHVQIFSHDN